MCILVPRSAPNHCVTLKLPNLSLSFFTRWGKIGGLGYWKPLLCQIPVILLFQNKAWSKIIPPPKLHQEEEESCVYTIHAPFDFILNINFISPSPLPAPQRCFWWNEFQRNTTSSHRIEKDCKKSANLRTWPKGWFSLPSVSRMIVPSICGPHGHCAWCHW